jgi:hypothetical protein
MKNQKVSKAKTKPKKPSTQSLNTEDGETNPKDPPK